MHVEDILITTTERLSISPCIAENYTLYRVSQKNPVQFQLAITLVNSQKAL